VGGLTVQFNHQPVTPIVDVLIAGGAPVSDPPLPDPGRQAVGFLNVPRLSGPLKVE
jgi:hypothetical protein